MCCARSVRDRKEWSELRARNDKWLAPWEASTGTRRRAARLPPDGALAQGAGRPGHGACPSSLRPGPGLQGTGDRGAMTVSSIVWGSAMMATLGYWVDQDRAGQGIAPTAVAMATDYCFRTLGLHRMEINIRPENRPSLRVVEKLGFRDEGYRPRFLHINGTVGGPSQLRFDRGGSARGALGAVAGKPPGVTAGYPSLTSAFVIIPVFWQLPCDTPTAMPPALPSCSYGFDCGLPS